MNYYVYVLKSEPTGKLYIGSTSDPDRRLKEHNAGKSRWTSNFRPWERIWLETYEEKSRALKREKYLKSRWGRRWLKKKFEE